MKFKINRDHFSGGLQQVLNVVGTRATMPILSNVLLSVKDGVLSVTATDLEVELVAETAIDDATDGEITVPGRKMHDIVRALPEGSRVEVSVGGERMTVKAGRSRFTLSTLRAEDFPTIDDVAADQVVEILQSPDDVRVQLYYGPLNPAGEITSCSTSKPTMLPSASRSRTKPFPTSIDSVLGRSTSRTASWSRSGRSRSQSPASAPARKPRRNRSVEVDRVDVEGPADLA